MTTSSSKKLILGLLSKMSLEKVMPFFLSLEKAGNRGDVCLFVSDLDAATLAFLRARRVNLIPFNRSYLKPKWARIISLIKPFLRPWKRARLEEQLALAYLHPHCARRVYCHAYLTECGAGYEQVMLADIRDILFQNEPFDFDMPDGLSVFMEDASQTIGTCPHTSNWVKRGYGQAVVNELRGERIFCAGTIFGSPTGLCDYFAQVLKLYYGRKIADTIDQGTLNYVLYKQPPPKVHRFDNDAGPVLTMGYIDPDRLRFNEHGLVVNPAGRVFNTLHQYDRHPELAQRLLKILT